MTKISRTSHSHRIREAFGKRMTNVDKIRFAEKVNRIEKTNPTENEHSDSYQLSYDQYYKTINELKVSFKRFYFFEDEQTPHSIAEHHDDLLNQLTTLVEKYNELIAMLKNVDSFEGTNYQNTFHIIFTNYAHKFLKIGIVEQDDFTLVLHEKMFIEWLENITNKELDFIRLFKLALMREYHSIFQHLSNGEVNLLKGLVIEEEG